MGFKLLALYVIACQVSQICKTTVVPSHGIVLWSSFPKYPGWLQGHILSNYSLKISILNV